MPQTAARQKKVHKLVGGSDIGSNNNSRKKTSKIKIVAPEAIVFFIIFFWLVACIQFYRHGLIVQNDESPQQQQQQKEAQDEDKNTPTNFIQVVDAPFPEHYMTFSTACSPFQDWQSYMFFYYAHKVSQPGYVVRIASGCSQRQQDELVKFHDEVISKLSPNFSVHFTPDFSRISGDEYKYFNKPFGLQHWLQNGLKFRNNPKTNDAIIMVLDPDMMLLRPLTYDFTDSNIIVHKSKRGMPTVRRVVHGQPWASLYGFGNAPFLVNTTHVFANITDDSPALHVTEEEQNNNYAGGPPYIATGSDMYAIVNQWCTLVTRVHGIPYKRPHDDLMDEMYGWSLAVAHLKLPHTLAESFMISNTDVGDSSEGWPLIDTFNNDELCEYPLSAEKADKVPYVIHYCQAYWLGKWFIGKYRLASNWLSCERPLLLEPPKDIGQKYDFYIRPGGVPYGTKEKIRQSVVKREQFMICQIIARFNEAATWLKEQTCEEGTANYEKSFYFHHSLDPENNDGGEKIEEP